MEEGKVEDAVVGVNWDCDVEGCAGKAWSDEGVARDTLIVELGELTKYVGYHVPEGFRPRDCCKESEDGGVGRGGEGFKFH